MCSKSTLKTLIAASFVLGLAGASNAQGYDYTAPYASLMTRSEEATKAVNTANSALMLAQKKYNDAIRTYSLVRSAQNAAILRNASAALVAANNALTATKANFTSVSQQVRAAQMTLAAKQNATYAAMVAAGQITSLRTTSLGRR